MDLSCEPTVFMQTAPKEQSRYKISPIPREKAGVESQEQEKGFYQEAKENCSSKLERMDYGDRQEMPVNNQKGGFTVERP